MSNEYRIERERRVVFLRRTERSTGAELAAFVHQFVTDADFEIGMCVLDDRQTVEETPETTDVRLAVEQLRGDRARLEGTRWAVVLGSAQPAIVGMYNMIEVLVQELGIEMRHFPTLDDAKTWLAIE